MSPTFSGAAHRAPMSSTQLATINSAKRAALIAEQIDTYPKPFRAAVHAVAARHARLADLALSFPALLFAIAIRRRHLDADLVVSRVIVGASLAELAGLARIPLWTRRLPPKCFWGPIPDLPDGEFFRRQISNHLRNLHKRRWTFLRMLSEAHRWCDDAFAIWCAREFTAKKSEFDCSEVRIMALWAWHSNHPDTPGHRFCEVKWQPSLSFAAALDASTNWAESMQNYFAQQGSASFITWLEPADVDGFSFVPLQTAEDILAEAAVMKNCMRGYGDELIDNTLRFWSVRRQGERCAVLSVVRTHRYPMPIIGELCGPKNKQVATEIWVATTKWLQSHDLAAITADRPSDKQIPAKPRVWIDAWKPYWKAKGRVPMLLPMRYKTNWRWNLRKNLTDESLGD